MPNNPDDILREVTPAIPALALRLRDAAKALAVSERTLWGWADAGEVPCIRKGGVVLFSVDGLRRWLDAQAQEGATR